MKISLRKSTFTIILIVLSLTVYLLESSLPPIFPGVAGARLGLSNVFIIYALYALGWQSALWVVVFKTIFGPILAGTPTGLFFSIVGSILSFTTMVLVKNQSKVKFGLIGVSILGSIAHTIGHFIIAIIFVSSFSIISYFPILAIVSVVCGIIVGLICAGILKLTQDIKLKNKLKTRRNIK